MAGAVGKTTLQCAGQLQLVEAEHRQGKRDKHQREGRQHPHVLQCGHQQGAAQSGRHTRQGIGHGHPQHIHQRQRKARLREIW
ncbi:hypothetical protein SDC9_158065 [bioreactor metagenome]|uniref:Uncharacterized protein n=1 Tax=bioreactor metagenome TaxID=1076179 RepID=A0A645F8T7_9ZZZZ